MQRPINCKRKKNCKIVFFSYVFYPICWIVSFLRRTLQSETSSIVWVIPRNISHLKWSLVAAIMSVKKARSSKLLTKPYPRENYLHYIQRSTYSPPPTQEACFLGLVNNYHPFAGFSVECIFLLFFVML